MKNCMVFIIAFIVGVFLVVMMSKNAFKGGYNIPDPPLIGVPFVRTRDVDEFDSFGIVESPKSSKFYSIPDLTKYITDTFNCADGYNESCLTKRSEYSRANNLGRVITELYNEGNSRIVGLIKHIYKLDPKPKADSLHMLGIQSSWDPRYMRVVPER